MNGIKSLPVVLLLVLALLFTSAANRTFTVDGAPGDPNFPTSMTRGDRTLQPLPPAPVGGLPDQAASLPAITGTGGPDWYGYTWDDSAPFSWIDAAGSGIDAGLDDEEWADLAGPINLPFPFRFYEDTYTHVWISQYGYVTFNYDYYLDSQQSPFPNLYRPNLLVAPFWTVIALSNSGPDGRVYYLSGGTAPNRFFVVEWHNVAGGRSSDESGGDEKYRFEVIFYENGDIRFQYDAMTYNDWRYFASIGIEDKFGNGLGYMDWSSYWDRLPSAGKAVLFKYPAPAARVNVTPVYFGDFSYAGGEAEFQIPVRNSGELGADTYDLSLTSAWPGALYAADGVTPLVDHDSDGVVDTGPVAQGATTTVIAKIDVPTGAVAGNSAGSSLDVRSSLDTTRYKLVSLSSVVPSSFAQVYLDSRDGAASLYLAKPGGQAVRKLTPDEVYPSEIAISEAPDGNFLSAWEQFRSVNTGGANISVDEIYYTIINRYGDTLLFPTRLAEFSSPSVYSRDQSPVVAVTPDGHYGLLWIRYFYDSASDTSNYNVYFAVLNATGQVVSAPTNITNNSAWGTWSAIGVPRYWDPSIAATTDNRFVLAWQSQVDDGNTELEDIYYAVHAANGSQIKGSTLLTNAAASGMYYYDPGVIALSGDRVMAVYASNSLFYTILDSNGNQVKPETLLNATGSGIDAAQLSGGNILVAWSDWSGVAQIQYSILSGSSYDTVLGPVSLSNPAAITGAAFVSVAPDAAGSGILTWAERDWEFSYHLYYALVAGDGSVKTQPAIFRATPHELDTFIETNYNGYGNTSYRWTPPEGVDLAISASGDLTGGQAGGGATVGISYANHSGGAVSGVVITATLGISLTYLGDSSGVIPLVSGNQVVWSMPDLSFLEKRPFALYLGVPANSPLGELLPVQLQAACLGNEVNQTDNGDSINIMVSRQVYLPHLVR